MWSPDVKIYNGKGMVGGVGTGQALITAEPVNFTASLTKPLNMLIKDMMFDRHHELFHRRIHGKILVFPACIGSTHTGLVLLELSVRELAPAAMIVKFPDSLLVSGAILGEVWYGTGIPLVAYSANDLFSEIKTGDRLRVDGTTGEIEVTAPAFPCVNKEGPDILRC